MILTNGEIYTSYIEAANQTLRPQDERIALAFARAVERAVIEKLCAGVVMPEAFGFAWQHDETGRVGFAEITQLPMWGCGNPNLKVIGNIFTADQLRTAIAASRLKALEDAAQTAVDAVAFNGGTVQMEAHVRQAILDRRGDAAIVVDGDIERKNKLLADTLQTLHNYCAAEFALYGDTAPLILRESIATITKELT